jgi:preprotein translocase subunit SecY
MTQAKQASESAVPALFRAAADAWRIPDLRFRILFTLGILVIFRFFAHVPVPGVDREALAAAFEANPLLGFLDLFSGGALRNLSIAALGVYPYITASIILQILTPIIPTLKNLSQEGEGGRQAINRYTHYLTVPLAFMQGYGQLNLFAGAFSSGATGAAISGIGIGGADTLNTLSILLAMTAGTMLLVWMGELVTEKGIGNGISLIIFAGIVSTLPQVVGQLWLLRDQMFQVGMLIFIAIAIVYLIVYFAEAQRKIPVQYGRSVFRGGQMYKQSGATHIPLRVNAAGMIPLIFSFSILILPSVVASYFNDGSDGFIATVANFFQNSFGPTSTIYWIAVFLLVVIFTFFYTLVVHNQQNLAENLQKNGGFVPGIRPGPPTKIYLMRVVLRITWGGALFLGFIAIMPFLAQLVTNLPNATTIIQSTSLLIMVGVALDTMRQLESQLLMRNYEGFVR